MLNFAILGVFHALHRVWTLHEYRRMKEGWAMIAIPLNWYVISAFTHLFRFFDYFILY